MTRGLLGTALLWGVLVVVLWRVPPRWPPDDDHWFTVAVVVLVIEFLALKSWLMAVRAWTFDRLTAALVTANGLFALVYLWFFLLVPLWPALRRQRWEDEVRHGLLVLLALALLWGLIEFWRIPDPDEE
jgi:hypothetical protein